MIVKTEHDWVQYFAGLMDGEGSFSIQVLIRSYRGRQNVWFVPRISMQLKYGSEILYELQKRFGGAVREKRSKPGFRQWDITDRKTAEDFARVIHPHLNIKRRIAERFLEALSYFPQTRRRHGTGERSWTVEQVVKVAEIALTLNPPRARKDPKNLEYLDQLKEVYAKDPAATLAAPPTGPAKGSRRFRDAAGNWHWDLASTGEDL